MFRGLILVAVLSISVARAAELDGIQMPDTLLVGRIPMVLNGIGIRTYSVFNIHIYVAGLYLKRRSGNPDEILHSLGSKLLEIRFIHDASAEQARTAWRDGFENNCKPPCYLDPHDVQRFLEAIPAIHTGDETTLLFSSQGVEVSMNHQLMGHVANQHFSEVILSTFIGPVPPTPQLKRQLLGSPD
jgi:hypothetical protein